MQILIWCFSALFSFVIGQTTYAQSCDNPTVLCGDEAESVNEFSGVVFSGSPVDFCFEGDMWTVARFHTTYRITNNPVLVTIDNIDCIGGPLKAMVVQPNFSDVCDISQYEVRSDCITLNTNDTNQFYTHNDTWDVTGLNNYPGSIINLYDRWGQQVLRKTGDYSWDGTSEKTGQLSPIGTYYYVININHMSVAPEQLTGYITLIR